MSGQSAPSERSRDTGLLVRRNLTLAYACSWAIALLVAVAAIAGLVFPTRVYPTEEVLLFGVPTDVISLVIVLPVLLLSIGLARRGQLLGLLCWPGALLYVLYVYTVYVVGVPLNALFLVYLLLVTLSAYTTIGLVASIDGERVRQQLTGNVPHRWAGGTLAILAVLFLGMQIVEIVAAMTGKRSIEGLDLAPFVADMVVLAPAWLIGGVLLVRRRALGYVAGAGLLLVGGILFGGVSLVIAFPALKSGAPLDRAGMAFMLAMAAVCLIPFALYGRGVVRSSSLRTGGGNEAAIT
jgi:hypothetical protein